MYGKDDGDEADAYAADLELGQFQLYAMYGTASSHSAPETPLVQPGTIDNEQAQTEAYQFDDEEGETGQSPFPHFIDMADLKSFRVPRYARSRPIACLKKPDV